MRIYYIDYVRDGNVTEAFSSEAKAKKRIRELRAESEAIRTLWQEYIITRQNKPTQPTFDAPDTISQAQFDISADGVVKAFLHRSKYADNK